MNDFSQKEERFFTMSVYMINEFKKKDSNSLVESISFDKMDEMPQILRGSVGCVQFRYKLKKIIVCLDSEEKSEQLILAYKDFLKCRSGDSLHNFTTATVNNILRSSCKNLFYINIF